MDDATDSYATNISDVLTTSLAANVYPVILYFVMSSLANLSRGLCTYNSFSYTSKLHSVEVKVLW